MQWHSIHTPKTASLASARTAISAESICRTLSTVFRPVISAMPRSTSVTASRCPSSTSWRAVARKPAIPPLTERVASSGTPLFPSLAACCFVSCWLCSSRRTRERATSNRWALAANSCSLRRASTVSAWASCASLACACSSDFSRSTSDCKFCRSERSRGAVLGVLAASWSSRCAARLIWASRASTSRLFSASRLLMRSSAAWSTPGSVLCCLSATGFAAASCACNSTNALSASACVASRSAMFACRVDNVCSSAASHSCCSC
mmetsp:Transcript_100343/g.199043  ORF Transcript_100343/g.199043 Transcript_100343/m.199043 type:complete len:263 (-) Transcript_100343:1155-1943(-)